MQLMNSNFVQSGISSGRNVFVTRSRVTEAQQDSKHILHPECHTDWSSVKQIGRKQTKLTQPNALAIEKRNTYHQRDMNLHLRLQCRRNYFVYLVRLTPCYQPQNTTTMSKFEALLHSKQLVYGTGTLCVLKHMRKRGTLYVQKPMLV